MTRLTAAGIFTAMFAAPAVAGTVVPLPIVGATGPIGIGIAVVGYVGYRVLRRNK